MEGLFCFIGSFVILRGSNSTDHAARTVGRSYACVVQDDASLATGKPQLLQDGPGELEVRRPSFRISENNGTN